MCSLCHWNAQRPLLFSVLVWEKVIVLCVLEISWRWLFFMYWKVPEGVITLCIDMLEGHCSVCIGKFSKAIVLCVLDFPKVIFLCVSVVLKGILSSWYGCTRRHFFSIVLAVPKAFVHVVLVCAKAFVHYGIIMLEGIVSLLY